jgi:hypothetical protein
MAKAVNGLMDPRLHKKFGRTVPSVYQIKRHLSKTGAKLANDDIAVVELDEDILIALAVDEDEESGEAAESDAAAEQDTTDFAKSRQRAAYVKDVMNRLVIPELQTIRKHLPQAYAKMKEQCAVDIVVAIDNTSRQQFDGRACKLEQAVINIILPDIDSAQQSPCLAIPIFFMEGEESYSSLQKALGEMVNTSLKGEVNVPRGVSTDTETLKVRWHLCSDHKLVTLFVGFGGSGCNKPCFVCNWDRSDPFGVTQGRTEADPLIKSDWSEKFLHPIHSADLTR